MKKNWQDRSKFSYMHPNIWPDLPFRDRRAIALNLDDAWYRNDTHYRIRVKGRMYQIEREKAQDIGKQYTLNNSMLPHYVPIGEWERIPNLDIQSSLFT